MFLSCKYFVTIYAVLLENAITYAIATPVISNNSDKGNNETTRTPKVIIFPITTYLLFSLPKKLDVIMTDIVLGITTRLRIGIRSTVVAYSGKTIGMTSGARNIPTNIIKNDTMIVRIFIFPVGFPVESSGNVYLKTIPGMINITAKTCNPRK